MITTNVVVSYCRASMTVSINKTALRWEWLFLASGHVNHLGIISNHQGSLSLLSLGGR